MAATSSTGPCSADPENDLTAINTLLKDSASAWSRGDLGAFMACYADSASTTYISQAHVVRGVQAIRAMYEARFGQGRSLGALNTAVTYLLPLGRRHAIVMGRYTLSAPDGRPANGAFTLVTRRSRHGWRILIDHST